MNTRLHTESRSVASILVQATLALLVCAGTAVADDPTTYKIRSRWLSDQFLTDRNGTVAYGTGNDATYLWTLEDAGILAMGPQRGHGGLHVPEIRDRRRDHVQGRPNHPRGGSGRSRSASSPSDG